MSSNIIITKFLNKVVNTDFFKNIINICLYPSDFGVTVSGNDSDSVPIYLNTFFKDLSKLITQYGHENKSLGDKLIETSRTILKLRGAGNGIVTYETIGQHYTATNAISKQVINLAIQEKIQDDESFRNKIDSLIVNIDYFYDFQRAFSGFTDIHEFIDLINRPEISMIEAVEKFKDMSLQLSSDLSNLSTVNRDETTTDYFILSDPQSINNISESIVNYIYDNYTFYKCGLKMYDDSIGGFESSSVHLIASPSNGGKSITLANLFYRIAQQNRDDFEVNDAALYITCEDDMIKTSRKFMSIFGNYDYNSIKDIYQQSNDFFTKLRKSDQTDETIINDSKKLIKNLFNDILYESIVKTTRGNLKIIFKYSPENSLSAGDIRKQLAKFKMQGINIKYLIIDYLDVLKPTFLPMGAVSSDEYFTLGLITQELRTLSRHHGIPVLSATQTTRDGDKVNTSMSNSIMGESWKKVKYSDFIFMQRIRDDLSIDSEDVKKFIYREGSFSDDPQFIINEEKLKLNLKVVECTVTKSKERGKGYRRYLLFCTQNLRLYNYIDEYITDMDKFDLTNKKLVTRVKDSLQLSSINNINNPIDETTSNDLELKEDPWNDSVF